MVDLLTIPLALIAGYGAMRLAIRLFPLRFMRHNFQNRTIPTAYGLVFVIAGTIYYASKYMPTGEVRFTAPVDYAIALLGFGILGLIDDMAGDRSVGGLRGHFRALFREHKITTGAIKAIGGIVLGCACAMISPTSHASWIIGAIVIAGSANTLNLVDLRPGRCLAFFLICCIPLLCYMIARDLLTPSHLFVAALPLHFAILTAAILFYWERKAVFMLGDTGANALGAVLGVSYVIFAPGYWQWVLAVAIIAFHIWTERHSFSGLIDATPGLRAIDRKIGVR